MGRYLVARVSRPVAVVRIGVLDLLPELHDFAQQEIDLLLLARHRPVQFFDQIFGKGHLDFECGQSVIDRIRIFDSHGEPIS